MTTAGVMMRGTGASWLSCVDLEARIPGRHPLRKVRQGVNEALVGQEGEFEALYTDFYHPSILRERLIRATDPDPVRGLL